MAEPVDPAPKSEAPVRSPVPNQQDLYLLIVGLVAGLLLGPGVLGRLAPEVYRQLFYGGTQQWQALDEFDQSREEDLQRLMQSGATPAAVTEWNDQASVDRAPLLGALAAAQHRHAQKLSGMMLSVLVGLALLMIGETLLSPHGQVMRERLTHMRYLLLAAWLALLMAQPTLLKGISWPVVVGLLIGFVAILLLPAGQSVPKTK